MTTTKKQKNKQHRATSIEDKTFFIEYNGKSVLWKPASQFKKNKDKAWTKLSFTLKSKRGFGPIDLNSLHIYYTKKNSLKMNTNELNGDTIEQFWNTFKADRRAAIMYFEISENLDGKEMMLNDKLEYYLIVKFGNKTLEWSPNTLTDIEWVEEFSKLKNDVCSYFDLEQNEKLQFKATEFDMNINDAEEIEMLWEEVENNDSKCTSLEVINGVEMKQCQDDEEKENVCHKQSLLVAIWFFIFFSTYFRNLQVASFFNVELFFL